MITLSQIENFLSPPQVKRGEVVPLEISEVLVNNRNKVAPLLETDNPKYHRKTDPPRVPFMFEYTCSACGKVHIYESCSKSILQELAGEWKQVRHIDLSLKAIQFLVKEDVPEESGISMYEYTNCVTFSIRYPICPDCEARLKGTIDTYVNKVEDAYAQYREAKMKEKEEMEKKLLEDALDGLIINYLCPATEKDIHELKSSFLQAVSLCPKVLDVFQLKVIDAEEHGTLNGTEYWRIVREQSASPA